MFPLNDDIVYTQEEAAALIAAALERIQGDEETLNMFRAKGYEIPMLLHINYYQPSAALIKYIDKYKIWCDEKPQTQKEKKLHQRVGGQLMEQIAYAAFKCLKGDYVLSSFTAAESQHDLVVHGHSVTEWTAINRILNLTIPTQKIIVEAKNIATQVDAPLFSRLCYTVDHKYADQCRLGIFFTRFGAKGFPQRGGSQQKLFSARATQLLFHASTLKYVVVFDDADIQELAKPGRLLELLSEKISNVEDMIGEHLTSEELVTNDDPFLPSHLKEVSDEITGH